MKQRTYAPMRTVHHEQAPDAVRTPADHTSDLKGPDQNPILTQQQKFGNAAVRRKIERRSGASGTIQRYQAGETGHEKEVGALTAAGFTPEEAERVYVGNWLRDFSQLMSDDPSFVPHAKRILVPIIGLGEFGDTFNMQDLGKYVPAEHMDDPYGAGTVEDPEVRKDPAKLKAATDSLSATQQAEQTRLNSQGTTPDSLIGASGLPHYIERSKQHAKNVFGDAIKGGRNDNSVRMMGEGLHAVEDYFSHSNFTEVALWTLKQEGNARANELLSKTDAGKLVTRMGRDGKPQVFSGTYIPGGNDTVSLLETVKTQLHTGQFVKAALKGLIRKQIITTDEVMRALGSKALGGVGGVLGGAVGGVGGAASGLYHGAGEGASSEFDRAKSETVASANASMGPYLGPALGEVMGDVNGVIAGAGGLFSGGAKGLVKGGAEGGKSGYATGEQYGNKAGSAVGGVAAMGVNTALVSAEVMAILIASPIIKAKLDKYIESIDALLDMLTESNKKKAAAQTRAKDTRPDAPPTHSDMAKDAPDHILWQPSINLAMEAVKGIGKAMQDAWAKGDKSSAEVEKLVDMYVSLPGQNGWWRALLASEIMKLKV